MLFLTKNVRQSDNTRNASLPGASFEREFDEFLVTRGLDALGYGRKLQEVAAKDELRQVQYNGVDVVSQRSPEAHRRASGSYGHSELRIRICQISRRQSWRLCVKSEHCNGRVCRFIPSSMTRTSVSCHRCAPFPPLATFFPRASLLPVAIPTPTANVKVERSRPDFNSYLRMSAK